MGLFSKITRSITKPLKKVIKSPFGKAALLGLGAYYGGQAGMFGKGIQDQGWRKFMGSKLPGWAYTPGTEATSLGSIVHGTGSYKPAVAAKGVLPAIGRFAKTPAGIGTIIGGGAALAAPELEEKIDIEVDDPTGHANYLTNRGMYEDEWADWLVDMGKAGTKEEALVMVRDNPMFSHGGRVKANTGLYAGGMGGMNQGMNPMTMNQGLGGMNAMGMGSPRSQMMGQQQDPRMAKMNQMQNINRGIQSVKPPTQSEDAELIQLIKLLTSMGIPMEQLRGRTKEELVELVVSVKGKMEGGRDVKETAEVIEEEDIREQNQAAGGGLMRSRYAIGSSQFGIMGNEHPIIPSKDGQQLDMRDRGGYQPHGKAEKHDDVRALLAQGEIVMTSDAVKGMGGGDRELGAKKMYDLMHNMEAMA